MNVFWKYIFGQRVKDCVVFAFNFVLALILSAIVFVCNLLALKAKS